MRSFLFLLAVLGFLVACNTRKTPKTTVDLPKPVSCSGGIPVDALADFKNPLPLFANLNGETPDITTTSKKAKQYFDQGFQLAVGFNHAEAVRSFRYALEQDPECAMCYWGLAYALGPNYNAGMQPEVVTLAYEAARKAMQYADHAGAEERAIIRSISKRYPVGPMDDRTEYDNAYTEALREAHAEFPKNDHISTLLAEAIMDQHPWDLWDKAGNAKDWTPEILEILETTLERNPRHAASVHLYIHATEASKSPDRALPYAKNLPELIPGAGHLVHMPSHTYIRTGDYHEGVIVNSRAVEVDSSYMTACYAAGIYPLMYFPHNYHFLTACAALEGNSELSLEAADRMVDKLDTDLMRKSGYETIQHFWSIPLYLQVKFARWQDILATSKPDDELVYPQGIWHYARAMAFINTGQPAAAANEYKQLERISDNKSLEEIAIFDINVMSDIIDIAEHVVAGELAAAKGDFAKAEKHLRKAIAIEDNLNYTEPPDWFFSVRHHLGPILIKAGKYAEAETVYREDLETFPKNGWALSGLYESLQRQQKDAAAAEVAQQLQTAWKYADVQLTNSTVVGR
ncbi:tetratricopeptide repeat protein [Flavilitoribacter nigricans]|uniref:Tetratricopeptide repeat protein n=1 Tax=Flavilitoribacter nigricans (strain ATCC 23147 / DSM 23189 / NBRC 102662 / NCIMB 1420 / SS-2) TaxID=1122177 RepID=A0A2D0N340_FLAN2|nr:hypothetical protein [Flavilitoribacter nigricans]PHN02915.1 hypothetical protein CRP01_29350 [Flavilitoribacter nigricans DSM 23189 = NBRC 102662]